MVNSISKIQIRSGRRNSLPNSLSVGEMAWATDTHELFIGNGLPDNTGTYTKVLTEHDNFSYSSMTLLNNQVSAITFYSVKISDYPAGTFRYSVLRNGAYQTGVIYFACDTTGNTVLSSKTSVGDSTVNLSVTTSGNNLVFQYTSTNTGYTPTVNYQ